MRAKLATLLLAVAAGCLPGLCAAQTAVFDFDADPSGPRAGHGLPLVLTSEGVTVRLSSPVPGAFSLQSDVSTGFRLFRFSGLYLYPNSRAASPLDMAFSRPVTSITIMFATTDVQQMEVPTTVRLTAYAAGTGVCVGSASVHGTFAGDTMPVGTLSFTADQPFDRLRFEIPEQPHAATGFLVDTIAATVAPVPEPERTPPPGRVPAP